LKNLLPSATHTAAAAASAATARWLGSPAWLSQATKQSRYPTAGAGAGGAALVSGERASAVDSLVRRGAVLG
jgi:hypothetical protein